MERLSERDGTDLDDPLRLQRQLRKELPPEQAAAVAEQLVLRRRAASRFGPPFSEWLWSSELLEMASHPLVARRRAERFARLGLPVVDGTVGAGVDLWALRAANGLAWGVERNPLAAYLAARNVGGVIRGDICRAPVALPRVALFLDPARRRDGARVVRHERYEPPLASVIELLQRAAAGAAKLAPGIDWRELAPTFEIEVVQLGRSLRELAIWSGAGATPRLRRAVLIDAGAELSSEEPAAAMAPGPLGGILYDPEPAVTRAGLVAQLAHRLGARPLEAGGAYLSADHLAETPLARAFAVLEVLPFSLSRLRATLRARGWRLGEVLRRHFPLTPEELRRLVGPLQGESVTVICTRVDGRPVVVVAQPVSGRRGR